jgi:hypothetical protein
VTTAGVRFLSVFACLAAAMPAAGCALDFDRYDPTDASAAAVTGADGATTDAAMPPSGDAGAHDATIDDATADAAEAASADQGTGPCMASPDCLTQAGSCGVACGQVNSTCLQGCDAQTCSDGCRQGEQSCLGKCISSCLACQTDAGCTNSGTSAACLNDSHP